MISGRRELPDVWAQALARLAARFGDRFATGEAICRQHAHTLTYKPSQPPDAVLWPENCEEVVEIVKAASAARIPVIAFGAGTSLEGHVNAPFGGVCIDFSRMNKIVAVRPGDLDCTIEAGVTRGRLAQELRHTGLFFPVDPGSEDATLAGMAATRASGTTTLKYGSMRENVLNLTAVLASGEVVRTAQRARKSAAGYDLTRLFVGSEGTLGLITELSLRLYGVPETVLAAVAPFKTIQGACNTVMGAIQSGLSLARCELLDAVQIRAVNSYSHLLLAECPTLFLEFHGSAAACAQDAASFAALAAAEGVLGVETASDDGGRRKLWRARHDALWAVKSLWPGREFLVTDVAVPLSHLASMVEETAQDIEAAGLDAPIVGHIGDGNFHCILAFDVQHDAEKVETFLERLVNRALTYDGTATGEHGIGQGKRQFLLREHGTAVLAMRAIKTALDPFHVLNPGKIFI